MLLIDLSQTILSGLIPQITKEKVVDESLVRSIVLNIIRSHVKKFGEYGQVVLCCDSRIYWRKDFFPFYKIKRKMNKEKSKIDWNQIYPILNKLKEELKENFPYKVIEVDKAEGDDIIGTLVPRHHHHEKIMIVSSDGDFLQLQKYGSNIKQYCPRTKRMLKSEDPHIKLKEKVLGGDSGDSIPNVLSASDSFALGIKQKSMTEKKLRELMETDMTEWPSHVQTNYSRNDVLINLDHIPEDIKTEIINSYEEYVPATKSKMLKYFMEHRLTNLMSVIEDF